MGGTTSVAKALRATTAYRHLTAQVDAATGAAVDGERYRPGEGQAYLERLARTIQQFREREALAAPTAGLTAGSTGLANRESRPGARNT
jgi:hypothetical protein